MLPEHHIMPYLTAPIDDPLCDIFRQYGKKASLAKKEYVLRKGTIKSFVFVESGLVGRIREMPLLSKQIHLEIAPPKRVANFMNFFSAGKADISIMALRKSEIYITPFDVIYDIMKESHDLSKQFEQLYGSNMETALKSSYSNFVLPCELRLLNLFKVLARQSQAQPDKNGWIALPYKLTREEYSQIIFASLLTVDNTLQNWKRENLYQKKREGSFIHTELLQKKITTALINTEKPAPLHQRVIPTQLGIVHRV